PFFYIYLYKVKDKIFKFLLLFTMPILLKTVADGYLSRNNIAVYLAFIGIYLVKEKYIPKTVAKFSLLIIIPIGLFLFYIMSQIRLGTQSDISFWQGTWNLIDSESSYPQYYDYANQGNSNVNIINFIIYIFIVCIPSSFYDLIHFSIPNLAYTFTETILGLSYGETNNYYILLPSVLGEAIMLCGKYFAFTYAFIYGIVSTWFLRLLKRNKSLEYLLIYYLLDFFRQFRGGSQYVITAWETQLVPLIIIVFFYKLVIKNGVAKERNEYNV
ncbi:TPA: hypothetical protein ACY4E2_002774, partial [Enterococcus faecium 1,230,933]